MFDYITKFFGLGTLVLIVDGVGKYIFGLLTGIYCRPLFIYLLRILAVIFDALLRGGK